MIYILTAAILFGASAPLSKLLLGQLDPIIMAAFLYLGSGVVAWLLFWVSRRQRKGQMRETAVTPSDVPWLAGAVISGGVVAPILLMVGLALTPASTASLLLNFEGVATGLLALWLFKEAVDRRIFLAMGLITLAAILLSWNGGDWGLSVGAAAILGACFFWGLDNNLTRQISAKDPLMIVGVKGLAAGGFSLLLALFLWRPLPQLAYGAAAMLLGAVSYGLSIQFFILGLRSLGAARTSTLYGSAPFVGTFLAFIILHEIPNSLFWVSMPLMLAGAWLMVSERHRHLHTHPAMVHTHPHTHPGDVHHTHTHESMPEGAKPFSHSHEHEHEELVHDHGHTPDLHHWHEHGK